MNPVLEGQVALVTGGSSGIGYGVAQALADAGASVAINYHSHGEAADALAASIEKAGGQAIAVQADVSDEAEIDAMAVADDSVWTEDDLATATRVFPIQTPQQVRDLRTRLGLEDRAALAAYARANRT